MNSNPTIKQIADHLRDEIGAEDFEPIYLLAEIAVRALHPPAESDAEPQYGTALSALKMILPFVYSPMGTSSPPPPEMETDAEQAKEKLMRMLGPKIGMPDPVPSIEDMRRRKQEASN